MLEPSRQDPRWTARRSSCGRAINAAGRIQPGVTQTLPPAEASKAHHLLETGTGRGKILLSLA
ncbi:zinc-binding dehydrogenase [Streptomyces prunicolor]|nr:zinc-binding dehydrogenase [Streptomyces prunicolor]MCX5240977.1 zinc-binding dehydrogenase [Streptomyces prunicolor]